MPVPAGPDLRLLLEEEQVMTVATCARPQSWLAPVFFVYFRGAFYFISSSRSRHIGESEAPAGHQAAAAIARPRSDWHSIQGLQMEGRIEKANEIRQKAAALSAYLKKFPALPAFMKQAAARGIFPSPRLLDLELYRFVAGRSFFLDNRTGFGHRIEIDLPLDH